MRKIISTYHRSRRWYFSTFRWWSVDGGDGTMAWRVWDCYILINWCRLACLQRYCIRQWSIQYRVDTWPTFFSRELWYDAGSTGSTFLIIVISERSSMGERRRFQWTLGTNVKKAQRKQELETKRCKLIYRQKSKQKHTATAGVLWRRRLSPPFIQQMLGWKSSELCIFQRTREERETPINRRKLQPYDSFLLLLIFSDTQQW